MEASPDWDIDAADFWDHRTLPMMDMENPVFDYGNYYEQHSSNECSPTSTTSTDDGQDAFQYNSKRRSAAPPPLPPLPSQQTTNLVSIDQWQLRDPGGVPNFSNNLNGDTSPVNTDANPQCWDHGCNGREFSSKSNFTRHKKEKEGEAAKVVCPLCGGMFTRNSARDTHLVKQSCNRIRRYSNGRPRPSKIALSERFSNVV